MIDEPGDDGPLAGRLRAVEMAQCRTHDAVVALSEAVSRLDVRVAAVSAQADLLRTDVIAELRERTRSWERCAERALDFARVLAKPAVLIPISIMVVAVSAGAMGLRELAALLPGFGVTTPPVPP